MKKIQTKNEFVEDFLKTRYLEDKIKFEKDPKNKGKTSTFGTTKEGRTLLMQHALAMYQLYLVAATLPETKVPVKPVHIDNPEYSLSDYIKNRVLPVVNPALFNVLINNGTLVDIQECITPEFELAVIRFGELVNFEKERDLHTGKKVDFLNQALVNYFNFFKNNGTDLQFAHAVVNVMTKKAKLSMSPTHTPNDIFSHYVTIVRASFS